MAVSEITITFASDFGESEKVQYNTLTFLTLDSVDASITLFSLNRKVGRVIDRAGLEIRYTPFGYRGFESLTFRQYAKREPRGFLFSFPSSTAQVSLSPPRPPKCPLCS